MDWKALRGGKAAIGVGLCLGLALPMVTSTGAGAAPAATTVSAKAKGTVRAGRFALVRFRGPKGKVHGSLSSGASGTKLVLYDKRFPFHGGFTRISTTRTGASGGYVFKVAPTLGTKYQVRMADDPAVRSGVVTMYVTDSFSKVRNQTSRGCYVTAPTKCTIKVSLHLTYPPAVAAQVTAEHYYLYVGVHRTPGEFSHPSPPKRLMLRPSASVRTTRLTRSTYLQRFSYSFSVSSAYTGSGWAANSQAETCIVPHFSANGFGLPKNVLGCGGSSLKYSAAELPDPSMEPASQRAMGGPRG